MKQQAFSAIKMKIDQEKNEVRRELAQLVRKKELLQARLHRERTIFLSRTKVLEESVPAGRLQNAGFSPERMKQLAKEIEAVQSYVQQTEKKMEILNEKEKATTNMQTAFQKEHQHHVERKEEQILRELKMLLTK